MVHQDWGTGQAICEKVAAGTLSIAAGRQDDIEGARERGVWLRKDETDGERRSKAAETCLGVTTQENRAFDKGNSALD